MRKIIALFRRNRKRPHSEERTYPIRTRIPPWSNLGRVAIAVHIADASDTRKGRKGWDGLNGI